MSPQQPQRAPEAAPQQDHRPRALPRPLVAVPDTADAPRRGGGSRWDEPALLAGLDAVALAVALAVSGAAGPLGFLYAAGVVAALGGTGLYRRRFSLQLLEALPRLLTRLAAPMLLAVPFAVWGILHPAFFHQVLLTGVGLVTARGCAYGVIRARRRSGRSADPTVIVGAGQVGCELARVLTDHPEYGLDPIGFVDTLFDEAAEELPLPLLGRVAHLEVLLSEFDVRRLIVAFGPTGEAELVGVLRAALLNDVEVHVVPRFFDVRVAPSDPSMDELRGIPLYHVRRAALRTTAWRVKRAVDVVAAAALLVLAAPVMGGLALAVRRTSPGPVLFRQIRVGQHGRQFHLYKFRSIRVDYDASQYQNGSDADDDAFTPIGQLLRRTSLDELPQLWNVLRGDMSLIGPRPEQPLFVQELGAQVVGYHDRHRLPVGLTGWAQVNGLRGDTSIPERARYDNYYIERWSLWFDMVIAVRTVLTVLRDFRRRR